MKKKKISALIAVFALLTAGPLTGCGKKESTTPGTTQKTEQPVHNHTFSAAWDKDETKHWNTCTDSSCNEKINLANHTFVWTEKTKADIHKDKVEKGVCSVCQYETERTIEGTGFHEWGTEWKSDISGHWHETTCTGHDSMKKDFAEHQGTWAVKTPAAYQQDRVDERTCEICNFHEVKTVPDTALTLKPRTITVTESEFIYNTRPYELNDYIVSEDKAGLKVEYRKKGTEAYKAVAPSTVGVYEYKITLPETTEYEAGEKTGEMKIAQYEVKLDVTYFEKTLGENLVDDKIQLIEQEVKFDDNTTRKVHIVADKSYDLAGINEIPTSALSIDDDNYALNAQDIENVTLKNYDTADFYCGIRDIFTFSGREDIMITTKIARGTLNKGDSLYIHENGKSITVTGIEKERVKVEKATVGEEVSLLVTGVKKEEVRRGYTISKKDTLKEYDLLYGKLYVFTKNEGGRRTPLIDSKNETYFPNIRFEDTNSEKTARMFYPSGTDMVTGGETVENVKFYLPTSTPAFVGRTFALIESGKTIAKVEVTGVHKHDANYSRNGTCYECNHSSGYSLKLDNYVAEKECKFIADETRLFTIRLDATASDDVTYRITISDTTNFSMVVKDVVVNAVIALSSSGNLVIEKNKFKLIGIHVTAKKYGTCKVRVARVFSMSA